MAIKDRPAFDKIIRARTNLLVSNGFFGFLAMHLNIVEASEDNKLTKQITTMAVDGYNLYYSPKFVHTLTERETEGVVAHEVMHCCFQHFARRQHRDPMKWNIAGDHCINLDLLDAGFTLPKDRLADVKFKGMNTETIYELLPDMKTMKFSVVGGEGDPGGCGGVMDAPGGGTEKAEVSRTWETSVRAAIQIARTNNYGNLPGSLKQLVDQLQQPKVSWRELTRRWIDQSLAKEVSWARPSRRSVAVGVPLPGMISDRLQHLVCFCDTSGSISYEMIREFVSEVAGALDQGTADQVTIVYADTDVQHVDTYYAGDMVEAGKYTGGGTAFSNSFKWLAKNVPDASAAIYFTDLCVADFGQEPNCPLLWAVYAPDHHYTQLAEAAPFGTTIHVSNRYC
jgi:predicted metal-dependent peptidase